MTYKVVYIEDQEADSVLHDLSQCDLDVVHCKPTSFKDTVNFVDAERPDLILMDFRLLQGGGEVDAPSIAQYYRTLSIDDKRASLPIVLLSNDQKIHGYYKDYTSHDLFDFFIIKESLHDKIEKYSRLMKELIESYSTIATLQLKSGELYGLLEVPELLIPEIDPRIRETLLSKKYQTNIYMASAFILNNVVKPIGVLIGEDVLAARLGVSKSSADWEKLLDLINECKYLGTYSRTYRRWWSVGIENWWVSEVDSHNHLRRLNSDQKLKALEAKFDSLVLNKVSGDAKSITESFWTVCQSSLTPVDPSEAFEIQTDLTSMPWLDSQYYSYESVRNLDLIQTLTDIEKMRFTEIAKRS
jgi:CheY-like chemotaxis protein